MKLKTIAASILFGCLCAGAVFAAGEQAARQADMKKTGAALGALGAIAKGQKPYDAETVKASLTTLSAVGKEFPSLFPPGTETGENTAAAPAIWANFEDFKAQSAKLAGEADKLLAALPADQAAVGAAMQTLGASCGTCHQTYRLKR